MQYSTITKMIESDGLRQRLVGAAAMEGRADAPTWVDQNIYRLVNTVELVDLWEYAEANMTVNNNPDIGARTDTILDSALLVRVQAVIAEDELTSEPAPEVPQL